MMQPLIKYRGGKRRELPNFRNLMPQNYETYIEPFLGGGAVFFEISPAHAIINDINEPLITFYNQVANQYPLLMTELNQLHDISVPSMPRLVRVKKLPADLMYEKCINDETLPLTALDK